MRMEKEASQRTIKVIKQVKVLGEASEHAFVVKSICTGM